MTKKLGFKEAAKVMIAAKLEPLEEYPGNKKPWRCKCLTCGKIVKPQYSSVQQGRNGCAYCAKRKVDPLEAQQIMMASQLQPLEDFPGAHKKWKCRCINCNEIVFPQYTNIQQGWGGCKKCAGLIVDSAEAKKFYESFGLLASEDYKGSHHPWRGVCLTCHNEVSPRYSDLKGGQSNGCAYCGGSKVNAKAALEFMISKGFETTKTYPGAMVGWRGNCGVCKNEIFPRYSAVKSGQGICKYCAGKALSVRDAMRLLKKANLKPLEAYIKAGIKIRCKCLDCKRIVEVRIFGLTQGESGCGYCAGNKIDEEEAVLRMRSVGFEPLVTYPGSKLPWKSRCVKCKKISTPSYGNVNLVGSGCIYCNRNNGAFDGSTSGIIYLITNSNLNAHKIGITSVERKSDRLKVHKNAGWKIYKTHNFQDGSMAFEIEQLVIDWLRQENNLSPYLSANEMPQGGYSETVDASEIDLPTIWAKVEELSRVKK